VEFDAGVDVGAVLASVTAANSHHHRRDRHWAGFEEHQVRIFEQFPSGYRLQHQTKRGTGIGRAIPREIIEPHGTVSGERLGLAKARVFHRAGDPYRIS
jgi:hypothetical protein